MKKSCGVYEIESSTGRVSYKIFASEKDLQVFLKRNKNKNCKQTKPVYKVSEYKEFPHTEVRKLTSDEVKQYMEQQDLFSSN